MFSITYDITNYIIYTIYPIHNIQWNNYYFIKRNDEIYLLQKNIAQVFYSNLSTFNHICWSHKIEKIPASVMELKLIRDTNPNEKSLKKATIISTPMLYELFNLIKRNDIIEQIQLLVSKIVCVLIDCIHTFVIFICIHI